MDKTSIWYLVLFYVIILAFILLVILLPKTNVATPSPTGDNSVFTPLTVPSAWTDPNKTGNCSMYSFPTSTPRYSLIGSDKAIIVNSSQTCRDDDQLPGIKIEQTCQIGSDTYPIEIFKGCLNTDGVLITQNGYQNTYYSPCEAIKCPGNVGILAFGYSPPYVDPSLPGAVCANYIQENLVLRSGCDYKSLLQLLRGVRANYDGDYVVNSSGTFFKFVVRQTNQVLAPNADKTGIALIQDNSIYYWMLTVETKKDLVTIPPQFIYVENPGDVPPPSNIDAYFTFISNKLSLQNLDGVLVLRPISSVALASTAFLQFSNYLNLIST